MTEEQIKAINRDEVDAILLLSNLIGNIELAAERYFLQKQRLVAPPKKAVELSSFRQRTKELSARRQVKMAAKKFRKKS